MIESLRQMISGKRLHCEDPLFGRLSTNRLKGQPVGDSPTFEWFADAIRVPGARFREIEQVVIHAGRTGPEEGHRRAWLDLLNNYPAFEDTLKQRLFDNYLWHKQMLLDEALKSYGDEDLSRFTSWPVCASAEEAFTRPCFDRCWLDVYADGRLELHVFNDWDEEHNLRVLVSDGQFVDMWQE